MDLTPSIESYRYVDAAEAYRESPIVETYSFKGFDETQREALNGLEIVDDVDVVPTAVQRLCSDR